MKKIFISLFCLFSLLASAQEEVRLRVTYGCTFMDCRREKPLPSDTLISDDKVLEIGNHRAVFYSERYSTYEKEIVALVGRQAFATEDIPLDISLKWFQKQGEPYRVFRDLSRPREITVTTNVRYRVYPYVYTDTLEKIRWNILKEDSVILGHNCRKAETDFRGRHWTVWFAKDIKYKLGPWKLGGLPGLILKASEDEGIFSFDCTKIEESCGAMQEFSFEYYQPCTLREFQSELSDFWRDSFYYICKKKGHSNPPRGEVPTFEAIIIDKLK